MRPIFLGSLFLVLLVSSVKTRKLSDNFTAAKVGAPKVMVSVWLSGWFKLTERIQKGLLPLRGRLFVFFAILWILNVLIRNRSASDGLKPELVGSAVLGVATLFLRCTPTLMRGRAGVARLVTVTHIVAGAATVMLSL